MKRIKLSFFGKNLIFSFLTILIVSVSLVFIAFYFQGKKVEEVIKQQAAGVGNLWSSTFSIEELKELKQLHETNKLSGSDVPVVNKSVTQLDQLSINNSNIAQGYLISPNLEGNTVTMLSMPTHIIESGVEPGYEYEGSQEFTQSLKKSIKEKEITFTDDYTDDYGTWVTVFIPITDANEEVLSVFGIDVDASMIAASQQDLLSSMLIMLTIALVLVSIVQFFGLRKMQAPLKELLNGIQQVSNGDFNVQLDVKSKDELGQLSEKFNGMVIKLKDIFIKIKRTSSEVKASTDEFVEIASQSTAIGNGLQSSLKEVASGLDMQLEGTKESINAMTEMSTGIQRIADMSSIVSEKSIDTLKQTEEGNSLVKQTITQMKKITNTVGSVNSVLKQLGNRSDEIGSIISVIKDISEQTNLLALNAAIEAARAGEHGKGFAVVADEVRKLAEQTQNSSDKISQLINETQNETTLALEAIGNGIHEVDTGEDLINKLGDAFQNILIATKAVAEHIQEVSATSEEMSASSEQITSSVEQIASIAQESAETFNKLSSSSKNQVESMDKVSNKSNALKGITEELDKNLSYFKV
ncbi:MAG: HAMP domain-containing protein [Bacillaceae bacterium]|nr:HAMP domain-containing protein [Bacillaceae bacterium]